MSTLEMEFQRLWRQQNEISNAEFMLPKELTYLTKLTSFSHTYMHTYNFYGCPSRRSDFGQCTKFKITI